MNRYLVDLHIHTLLSPCGDLGMSPAVIVERSLAAGLDAIAICDHNATHQVGTVCELGAEAGLTVFRGIEITTREEAHCVALLPDAESSEKLQAWVDGNILRIPNVPEKFGDQIWVDCDEMIAGSVDWYLNSTVDRSVEEIAAKVLELGGLFVAAHVDRQANSVIGQLGFIPPSIPFHAIEYNWPDKFAELRDGVHKYLSGFTAYTASDAHFPHLIGTNPSWLYAEGLTFDELRRAFAAEGGRCVVSRQTAP